MGVSVSKLPETWKQRIFFLLYVFYCFAIITVFQAFFVSYLVEPGYQKQIKTVDEVINSELLYGFNTAIEIAAVTVGFTDHKRIAASRRVDCDDMVKCTRRMIIQRDIMTGNAPIFANYIANTLGVKDGSKIVCHLDENIFYISGSALVNKGSPFLDRLNKLIRRCLEGALVERYWSEINTLARLRSTDKIPEDSDEMFFVFTVSHLSSAFGIFILGNSVSFVVFLCEIIYRWLRREQIK
jgi:hypothetical protein